jgi:hypothetical protein
MLSVNFAGQHSDVLTDVYLEQGEFAGCIRYAIQVNNNGHSSFNEYAIGNGLIVSTSYGSGDISHIPIGSKEWDRNSSIGRFSDNRMGICHIIPTYLARVRSAERHLTNKIQYTVQLIVKFK